MPALLHRLILLPLAAAAVAMPPIPVQALETEWVNGFKHRTRLTAGRVVEGTGAATYAFFEIEMPRGWKTYWRNPGDAGGIPPVFDWSKSVNLKQADVLYPAPHRMTDKAGDTIGYKERVAFPIRLVAADGAAPVTVHLNVQFGVCEKICVPAEASLSLSIPADIGEPSADALTALELVPRTPANLRDSDPAIVAVNQSTGVAPAKLTLTVKSPGGPLGVDVFLEAPDGLYLPLPKPVPTQAANTSPDVILFVADLSKDVDLKALKGKEVRATAVSPSGQSEITFNID